MLTLLCALQVGKIGMGRLRYSPHYLSLEDNMPSLTSCVTLSELGKVSIQVDPKTRDVRFESVVHAAAKKAHGPDCRCEACSSLHMEKTRDLRKKKLKAMMPGNVDMGNRGMGSNKKFKADANLMMKKVKAKIEQVPPPKQKVGSIKPSQLMHDKGKILKG